MNFLANKNYGIGLPASLRMPEYPEFSFQIIDVFRLVNYFVHTDKLVVLCHDLRYFTIAVVKEQEVFKDIHQVLLAAGSSEHGV